MKFFLLSDNIDTQMGMRLAGIPGVVVHEESEVRKALDEALKDDDIAVILLTDKIMHMIEETVNELKLSRSRPLIVEIPDRHASDSVTSLISRYVERSVGIKI